MHPACTPLSPSDLLLNGHLAPYSIKEEKAIRCACFEGRRGVSTEENSPRDGRSPLARLILTKSMRLSCSCEDLCVCECELYKKETPLQQSEGYGTFSHNFLCIAVI